jgi:hypothetical protein
MLPFQPPPVAVVAGADCGSTRNSIPAGPAYRLIAGSSPPDHSSRWALES